MELFGIHGTTKSRADKIIDSSFQSKSGRVGTGIYFWRKNAYACILAKGWYDFYLKKNEYDNDDDNRYCFFNVKIKVNEDNFLDLEDPDFKDQLALIAQKRSLNRKTDEVAISALIDYFINELEKELNTKFKVWQARVNAPYTCTDYPLTLLGNPISYVVIDSNCIQILRVY